MHVSTISTDELSKKQLKFDLVWCGKIHQAFYIQRFPGRSPSTHIRHTSRVSAIWHSATFLSRSDTQNNTGILVQMASLAISERHSRWSEEIVCTNVCEEIFHFNADFLHEAGKKPKSSPVATESLQPASWSSLPYGKKSANVH